MSSASRNSIQDELAFLMPIFRLYEGPLLVELSKSLINGDFTCFIISTVLSILQSSIIIISLGNKVCCKQLFIALLINLAELYAGITTENVRSFFCKIIFSNNNTLQKQKILILTSVLQL